MRLLVIEFITGGGLAGAALPEGLAAEGAMMLEAVLHDASLLEDLRLTIARDRRLPALPDGPDVVMIDDAPWTRWEQCIGDADAVLPIAPETGGALERLNALVLAHDKLLLGCAPQAVAIGASKRRTAQRLSEHGVPAVVALSAGYALPPSAHGWVLKPDDGAGSERTFFATTEAQLRDCLAAVGMNDFVVTPYLPGVPMSLSLLCTAARVRVLACNRQVTERKGAELRQKGVTVNGAAERALELRALGERVYEAIPGLSGYVGVDFIDTPEGPTVLEINPRLTTAYAGLSRSLGVNALNLLLRAARNDDRVMDIELGARPVTVESHG